MKYRFLCTILAILAFTTSCTWTAPGPTLTSRPTATPGPTNTPAPTLVSEPDPTPGPTVAPLVIPTFPAMPEKVIERSNMFTSRPPMIIDPARHYQATIKTSKGNVVCELYAAEAPLTVNNFVYLARAGFYAGLTFHRYVQDFVIQGGDPLGQGSGGPGYTLPAEIGLPHPKGALAMARQSDQVNPQRESSGSQFYVTLVATPHLDGAYTVFGRVIDGMSVVEQLRQGDLIQDIVITEE
jgi:cyclophilin family peptidyl-prolyl cis-trans isomerase